MITPNSHLSFIPRMLITMLAILTQTLSASTNHSTLEDTHFTVTAQTSTLLIPGQDGILIIEIAMDDGWHTYWPGLNDTGYGISLDVVPAQGLTFGDPLFPTPTRHIAPGNILDHIYEGTFQILIPYATSTDLVPGTMIPVGSFVDALVCKDICIPEKGGISLMLAVIKPTDINFKRDEVIEAYNNRPTDLTNAKLHWSDDAVQLRIPGATHYQFFPNSECTQPADLIKEGDAKSKNFTLTFDRRYEDDPTTPAVLSGRLRVKFKDTWQDFDVNFTQPTPTEPSP